MYSEKEKREIGLFYTKLYQKMSELLSEEEKENFGFHVTKVDDVGIVQIKGLPFPHLKDYH